MSKTTASAAGAAMPASGQPNIADAFEQTRSLIIAASNLAAPMDDPQGIGLHAVICAAEEQFNVAFDWFEAGHKPIVSPADPDPEHKLLEIVDELFVIRCLVNAAWMAADSLGKEERDPMKALLNIAVDKLKAAGDKLYIACGGTPVEDRDDD